MAKHQSLRSEAEAIKALGGEARQAWRVQAERTRAAFKELSAAKLTHGDPGLAAKLEACERALAAFIAAVEEWPEEEVTMSTMLQQRTKLSLANAAVLEAMKALPLDALKEPRGKLHLKVDSRPS
jgi:hypothetical protein